MIQTIYRATALLTIATWIAVLTPMSARAAQATVESKDVLTYPRPEVIVDDRGAFPLHVLRLILSKVPNNYTLLQADSVMDQERALRQLEQPNGGIDIMWTMTSNDRERQLLAIPIPVDKGLFGWRLAIISKRNPDLFKSVHNLPDLRKFVVCQGHDWPDTTILRDNGMRVAVDPFYQNLFRLVSKGLADYFPRSSLEIWKELDVHRDEDLMLDPYLAIHYPAAMYFFVNKSNLKLADTITSGFQKAIADGSFEKIFQAEYGDKLRRANFASRRVIEIGNPFLPASTPFESRELWFVPSSH